DFNFSIAESNRFSLLREDNSWLVAIKELYSSNDITTIPESFPRLIIRVSKFLVTLSRYDFMSFLKSEIFAINISCVFFVQIYVQKLNIQNKKTIQVICNLDCFLVKRMNDLSDNISFYFSILI